MAITIIVLCLYIGIRNPVFFTVGNVFDLLRSGIVMGIFAMGVLIVIVSGGIDVSFTAIAIFALYSTVRFLNVYSAGMRPSGWRFVIAAAIGLGLGMINAFFIAQFKLPTLIVTLATLSMFHGFLLFAIGNNIIRDIPPSMTAFARTALARIPMERGTANLHPAIFLTVVIAVVDMADPRLYDAWPQHLCPRRRARGRRTGRFQRAPHPVFHLRFCWPASRASPA